MKWDLNEEIALVTGGSRGIGKACALALAQSGAEVIINYVRSAEAAEEVCQQVAAAGGRAMAVKFNIADTEETKSAVGTILKEKKKISILVNNSGVAKDGLSMRYSFVDWNHVLETNLRGAFFTTQAVMRSMMKEKRGSIINMSSIVGVIGNPGQAAYCASKAGLIGLTKSLAKELASRNIRVNAIAPGYIQTDMTGELTPEQKEEFLKSIPLGKPGTPEDIAGTVCFLASPASQYMTGQVLMVDGGMGM